jgi:UDP-N-acetylglucosamine acyltransferase
MSASVTTWCSAAKPRFASSCASAKALSIVGLSGVRADIIPWGLAQGPLADLIGLNVVGLRRRDFSKADIHVLRQAYQAMFFGVGTFRERFDQMAKAMSDHPLVAKVVEFVRAGARPLTMAVHRAEGETP